MVSIKHGKLYRYSYLINSRFINIALKFVILLAINVYVFPSNAIHCSVPLKSSMLVRHLRVEKKIRHTTFLIIHSNGVRVIYIYFEVESRVSHVMQNNFRPASKPTTTKYQKNFTFLI